jgi:hypothetical protein
MLVGPASFDLGPEGISPPMYVGMPTRQSACPRRGVGAKSRKRESGRASRRPGRWAAPIAVVLVLFCAGCGDLSRDELNRGVESISSIAAEGGLVANGVARDGTKSTYARVMSKTLGGEAEHEAEKLADATPEAAVGKERDAAVQVAREIAELFAELQTFPGDERHGAVIERHMAEAKGQADAIVERLTGEPQ